MCQKIDCSSTDLAFLDFDLNNDEKPPSIICESQTLGVQELDRSVLAHLPESKAARVARLDAPRREELKRSLYVDEAPYRLEGNTTVGTGAESQAIGQCVLDFAKEICEFVGQHRSGAGRKGEFREAAKHYIEAKRHQPQEDKARAMEAIAYYHLADKAKAYGLAGEDACELIAPCPRLSSG